MGDEDDSKEGFRPGRWSYIRIGFYRDVPKGDLLVTTYVGSFSFACSLVSGAKKGHVARNPCHHS